MRPRQLIPFLRRQVLGRPFLAVLYLMIIVYFSASFLIMISEEVSLGTATTMIIPAFLGELGGVESKSVVTQVSVLAALMASVGFLALITARITSMFVEFSRRGGSVVNRVRSSGHVIICGWNFQGERIVTELMRSDLKSQRDIVVLADYERRPVKDERVEFVRGDPTQDKDLLRAGVERADSVIVLSDLTKDANEADAEALMIALAVESLNREVHTCVQVLNSANRVHLERAHADEIICLDQMGGSLAVAAALNHGVSTVLAELLCFDAGCEFYRYHEQLSGDLIGKSFCEAVKLLVQRKMVLIAVETEDSPEMRGTLSNDILRSVEGGTRMIVVNPQSDYTIRQGDALFLIAESEPTGL